MTLGDNVCGVLRVTEIPIALLSRCTGVATFFANFSPAFRDYVNCTPKGQRVQRVERCFLKSASGLTKAIDSKPDGEPGPLRWAANPREDSFRSARCSSTCEAVRSPSSKQQSISARPARCVARQRLSPEMMIHFSRSCDHRTRIGLSWPLLQSARGNYMARNILRYFALRLPRRRNMPKTCPFVAILSRRN